MPDDRFRRIAAIGVGLALALASPAPARAGCRAHDPLHDTDEYLVVRGAALDAATTDARGGLVHFGSGGELGVTIAGGCRGLAFGFDASVVAIDGDRGRAIDLAGGLIVSAPLSWPLVPFGELGGAAGRLHLASGDSTTLGPTFALGLEGFVGRHVYWRLSLDAIGAGESLFAAEASVGWAWPE